MATAIRIEKEKKRKRKRKRGINSRSGKFPRIFEFDWRKNGHGNRVTIDDHVEASSHLMEGRGEKNLSLSSTVKKRRAFVKATEN